MDIIHNMQDFSFSFSDSAEVLFQSDIEEEQKGQVRENHLKVTLASCCHQLCQLNPELDVSLLSSFPSSRRNNIIKVRFPEL